jgi:hypothetical protein
MGDDQSPDDDNDDDDRATCIVDAWWKGILSS